MVEEADCSLVWTPLSSWEDMHIRYCNFVYYKSKQGMFSYPSFQGTSKNTTERRRQVLFQIFCMVLP